MIQGLYFGIMLTMLVYLHIRDRNYLYYLGYLGAFILFQATLSGYSYVPVACISLVAGQITCSAYWSGNGFTAPVCLQISG